MFKPGDLCYRSSRVRDANRMVLIDGGHTFHDDFRFGIDVHVPAKTPILIIKAFTSAGYDDYIALFEEKLIWVFGSHLRKVGMK